MGRVAAYLRKASLEFLSYRLSFALSLAGPVLSVVSFFFIDRLFGHRIAPHLEPFGVSYFSYVLVGMMTSGFLGGAMSAVAGQIGEEQTAGTFEMLMATPTSVATLACAMAAWNLVTALLDIALYVLVGMFVFGVNFGNANLPAAVVVLALAMTSFGAVGMLSASFALAFKRGDPVSLVMNMGMEILGGVFFPVTVLPDWLRMLSYLFPTTYAVRAMEMLVYRGAGLFEVWHDVAVLSVLSLVLVPLAFRSLDAAVSYGRRRGTLVHY